MLRIDHFGNLITNVTAEDVPALAAPGANIAIRVGNGQAAKIVQTFAAGAPGEVVGLIRIERIFGNCVEQGQCRADSRRRARRRSDIELG